MEWCMNDRHKLPSFEAYYKWVAKIKEGPYNGKVEPNSLVFRKKE